MKRAEAFSLDNFELMEFLIMSIASSLLVFAAISYFAPKNFTGTRRHMVEESQNRGYVIIIIGALLLGLGTHLVDSSFGSVTLTKFPSD